MNARMTAIRFDTIIFDLDGTLVDTGPDLTAALNHVLSQFGRQTVNERAVRDMVGHGARKLLERGLAATGECTEALVERGMPIFLVFYAANYCVHSAPYAGIEAAMDALAAQGKKLAICTNKPEALTHKLLAALGWQNRFAAIVGGDSLPVRKPDPAPLREALARAGGADPAFVGDSITDTDTARAARVPSIAVSFGFSDRPPSELGADMLIHHFDELLPALARL